MKINQYFWLDEFMPLSTKDIPDIIRRQYIHQEIYNMALMLRIMYGPVIINDYMYYGDDQFCGYRPHDCKVGAAYSMHRLGRALDVRFERVTIDEVRDHIRAHADFWYCKGLRRVATYGTTRLHIDTADWGTGGLYLIPPAKKA